MAADKQKKTRSKLWLTGVVTGLAVLLVTQQLRSPSAWALNAALVQMLEERVATHSLFSFVACQTTAAPMPTALAGTRVDPSLSQRQLVYLGYQDLEAGRCEKAIHSWQAAVALDPTDRTTIYRLGLAYCRLGMLAEAQCTFQAFQDLAKIREHITAYGRYATTDNERVSWLEIAFCIDPSRTAFRRLEKNLPLVDREDEIPSYLSALVEWAPENTFDHWWARGSTAENERDWSGAKQFYLTAIDYAENSKDLELLYNSIARMFARLGDTVCAAHFEGLANSPASMEQIPQACVEP